MKEIELTKGFKAIVDDEDFDRLNSQKWCYSTKGYAVHNGPRKQRIVRMHRLIMNAPDGMEVDHKNGNTLDNRKDNLRIATHQQNMHNQRTQIVPNKSSKYKGVSLRNNKYWRAQIKHDRKTIHLGYFATEDEAARAYDQKAKELFGEYAKPNFKD